MIPNVTFGNKNSYDDWNIVRTHKDISIPQPKISKIEIEGADGDIDTSEVLCGEIKFKNRTLTFEFTMLDDYSKFNEKITEIANYLQGRKLKIILSDDSTYYYVGRCTIDEWSSDKRIGKIVIKCDCDPWKYDLEETIITKTISTSETFDIIGKRRTVCPTFKSTADMTITFNGDTYSISANSEGSNPNIQIKEGINRFTIAGNGTITISYQGGEL
ncbi:MAG: hypothetical protein MSS83_05445 [Methanobrevibacter sp.]|uniref:hypothetical protein n=1 Tax=Methanobrevibacter sp. TaxID=66852 RepID=UPI0031F50A1C|nr:hypothetical protein [Methanobrevibacter sp.]